MPYVRQPNNLVLGKPLFYATAMPLGAYGTGLLVESHEGRPTKIEGNPQHPSSLGGTDVFNQASVLTMYDPDRSQVNTHIGETHSWPDVLSSLRDSVRAEKEKGGAGLRVLSGATSSPSFVAQMQDFLKTYPQAKWYQWEAVNRDNVYAGAQLAFGQPVETIYDFSKAKVLLSLDCDFLSSGYPGFQKYTREFSRRRRPELKEEMLRFYAVESAPTNTGGKADHRLPMKASEVEGFARALATALGAAGGWAVYGSAEEICRRAGEGSAGKQGRGTGSGGRHADVRRPTRWLMRSTRRSLAVGKTVSYTEPVDPMAAHHEAGAASPAYGRDAQRQGGHAGGAEHESGVRRTAGLRFLGRAQQGCDCGCIWGSIRTRPRSIVIGM